MTQLTVSGNLAGDPELRFTPSGRAVANFTVCHTPRTLDRASGEYRDGETMFLRCSIWAEYAQHVAASLHRGDRVLVTGRLRSRTYDTNDQPPQKRTVFELDADEVGPSLRFAECSIRKAERADTAPAVDDPWVVPPALKTA